MLTRSILAQIIEVIEVGGPAKGEAEKSMAFAALLRSRVGCGPREGRAEAVRVDGAVLRAVEAGVQVVGVEQRVYLLRLLGGQHVTLDAERPASGKEASILDELNMSC